MPEPLTAKRIANIRAELDEFASWPTTFKLDYRAAWLEGIVPRLLGEIERLSTERDELAAALQRLAREREGQP